MINLLGKLKAFNLNNGNFLNNAPKLINYKQIELLKKKKIKKLINLNFFYKNNNFNKYFWDQIISYLKYKKISEENFFKKIKKNFNHINILEVIFIYQICLLIGKFRLAFRLRNFFFKKVNFKSFYFKSRYLKKLEKINNLLQNKKLNKNKESKIKILRYLSLKNINQINSDYSKFIHSKDINLIGVGVSQKKNIKNYLNADVIVKMNFHNKMQTKKFPRCDVSYYSDNLFLKTKKIIQRDLNLKFMLVKKSKNIQKYKNYNVREFQIFNDVMFGTPSLLINCTLDLLSRSPKSLKIFNSTIYYPLGQKLYDANQKKIWGDKKRSNVIGSFGTHDVVSEFLILRNLFKLKIIKVDKNLKYILNLNINKFLGDMENFYKKLVFDFYN